MFYEYLKSIHKILKNYNSQKSELSSVINKNENILNGLAFNSLLNNNKVSEDPNFDSLKNITGSQKGGALVDRIGHATDQIIKEIEELGGLIGKHGSDYDKLLLAKIKRILEFLVNYIVNLQDTIKTKDIDTLKLQVGEMQQIINKYL